MAPNKDHDDLSTAAQMSHSHMMLILDNLASEMEREARLMGRVGDIRPNALRKALQKLKRAGVPVPAGAEESVSRKSLAMA